MRQSARPGQGRRQQPAGAAEWLQAGNIGGLVSAAGRYFRYLPYLVLASGLLITWLAWRAVDRAVEARADLQFAQEVNSTVQAIQGRLRTYEFMLRGGAGLFFASENVSREEFGTYLQILQIQAEYPGIQGFGFAAALTESQLEGHVARVRSEGFPGYAVHPAGVRPFYVPVVYLEPAAEGNRTAFGFDMLSEPVRRAAMERARDSGSAAVSGIVGLVEDIDGDHMAGFLMYLPVYAGGNDPGTLDERRSRLTGFVYATFRVNDLLSGILPSGRAPVTFTLHDGSDPQPEALLFRSAPAAAVGERRRAERALQVAGRHWTASFAATPEFEAGAHAASQAPTVAGTGMAISLILFVMAVLASRMVRERRRSAQTIREAQHQLFQAQKMDSIGQLTGGIAHDFNNLLTVVMSNAESLAERLDKDDRSRRLAEMILRAAQRGADLTNRLLAIARRQALAPRATDVGAQLAGMESLLRRSLGGAVELELRTSEGLWPALVDPAQLESALLNLCINARDAMPNGGRLAIGLRNRIVERSGLGMRRGGASGTGLAPGGYVVVTVTDTGIGMNDDTLSRAFDPFFTTKGIGEGSGLGLSMVYGFAKQSNGLATIASSPGAGTTVTLYLPQAREMPAPAPEETAGGRRPRGSERILLVEDDDMVRGNVTAELQGLGYTVETAASGPQALARLDRLDGVDLLFTDLVMPGGMTGWQLAEEVRRRRPDLPVLFTSGHMQEIAPLREAGWDASHILQKPYRRREMARQVRRVLDGG